MGLKCLRHRLENFDSRSVGDAAPIRQEAFCRGFVELLPELIQVLFEIVGCSQRFIEVQSFVQSGAFVLGFVEVVGTFEQKPADSLENILAHRDGFTLQVPTQLGEFLVHELDDVEAVEDMLDVGQVFPDRRVVGTRHVGGHSIDLSARATEPFPEGIQGIFPLSFANEHNGPGFPVDHDREEFVRATNVDFVDRQNLQITQARSPKSLAQILLVDAADHRFAHPEVTRHIQDCHHLAKVDCQSGKALGVLTQRLDLRNPCIEDPLANTTFQSRNLNKQMSAIQTDGRCMHTAINRATMNH